MKKSSFYISLIISCILGLSGCANMGQNGQQTITKAMVIVPPKPDAPNPKTATQRDVAIYIVNLRGWGDAMALQLNNVYQLLDANEKD